MFGRRQRMSTEDVFGTRLHVRHQRGRLRRSRLLRHLHGARPLRRRGLQQVRRRARGQLLHASPMHSAHLPSGWLRLRPKQRRMRRYAQLRFVRGSGFLRRRRVQRVWAPDRAGWWRRPLRRANLRGAEHPVRTRRGRLRTSQFLWIVHDAAILRRRGGAEPVWERRHVRPRDVRAARRRVRIRERRMRRCAGLRRMRHRGALHPREMPRARARAGRRTDLRSAVVCGVPGLLRPCGGRLRRRDRMQRRGGSADAVRLPCIASSAHHLVLAADLRADGRRVWPGGRWLRQRPRLRIVLAARGLRRRRTEQVRIVHARGRGPLRGQVWRGRSSEDSPARKASADRRYVCPLPVHV